MVLIAGVTLSLVAFSALVHFEALRLCNDHLPRLDRVAGRAKG